MTDAEYVEATRNRLLQRQFGAINPLTAQSAGISQGGLGGTRQGIAINRPQSYFGGDIATGPDLAGYFTCGSFEPYESKESIREAATKAEHARILAKLEECRPTSTVYSRRDWALEERGAQRLWDKIAAKLGMPE